MTIRSQSNELGISIPKLYLTGPRSDVETIKELQELVDVGIVPLSADSALHSDSIDHDFSALDFVAVCAGMRGKK